MGTSLTGLNISSSYLGLLKTTDNAIIGSSGKRLTDGGGTDSPLYLSTGGLGIGVSPATGFKLTTSDQSWIKQGLLVGGTNGNRTNGSTLVIDGGSDSSVDIRFILDSSGHATSDGGQIGFANDGMLFLRSYETSGSNYGVNLQTNGGNTILFAEATNKNVGINTLSPSSKLTISGGDILLDNSNKVLWGNTSDVYISGTTVSDNIQLGVGGSTQFTFAQTTGMRLHQYGSGNITGTVTQRLGVTSAGQVVEIPIGGGAVDGAGTANDIVMWSDANTITDAPIAISGNNSTFAGSITGTSASLTTSGTVLSLDRTGGATALIELKVGGTVEGYLGATTTKSLVVFNESASEKFSISNSGNATFAEGGTFGGGVIINHGSGDSLLLTKTTTEPSLRFEGDTDKDFCLTISGETFTITQNDGATDILILDHDTKNATFAGDVTIQDSSPQITLLDTTNNTDALIYSDDTGSVNISADENNEQGSSAIKLYIDGGEKARLDSSGNLGLGTTSPNAKLDVNGAVVVSPNTDGKDTFTLTTNASNDGRLLIKSDTTTKVDIQANGVSYFNGGNVGIGDSTPNALLKLESTSTSESTAFFYSNASKSEPSVQIWQDGAGSSGAALLIRNDGSGNALQIDDGSAGNAVFTIGNTGNANFAGDVTLESSTSTKPFLTVKNTNADASAPQLRLIKDSASPADNDETGRIYMYGDNDAGEQIETFLARTIFTDVSDASEDSTFEMLTYKGGTQTSTLALASGNVGIGTSSPQRKLSVYQGDSGTSFSQFINTTTGSTANDGLLVGIEADESAVFWNHENTHMLFATNNGEKMRITTAGNVGIGTSSPSTKLEISGSGAEELLRLSAQSGFMSFYDGSTRTGYIQSDNSNGFFNIGVEDSNAFRIYMGASERIRISSGGDTTFNGDIAISKDVPAIDFVDTNSDDDFRLRNNNGTFEIFDTTNTGARFQVNSDGNSIVTGALGIGATPSEDLHITGDTPVIRLTDSDTSRDAQIVAVDGNLRFDADNSDAQSSTNISFRTDGGEAMRIDASRRLGIGTTSPSRQLTLSQDVSGETQQLLLVNRNDTNGDTSGILFGVLDNATYAKAGIFFERTGLQARGSLHFATDGSSDSGHATKSDARMTITSDGNVGIGTTSPTATLQVTGDIKIGSGAGSGSDSNNMSIQVSNATYGDTSNLGLLVRNNGTNGEFAQIGFGYSESRCPVVIGSVITSGASATKGDFIIGTRSTTTGSDAPTERMRITSAGNVGIGTTTPYLPLQISQATSSTGIGSNSSYSLALTNTDTTANNLALIGFNDGGAGAGAIGFQFTDHTNNYGDLLFITRDSGGLSERLRITSGGVIQNATINSSTSSALKISNNAGSGNFTYGMTIEDDSSNTGFILFAQSDGTSVGSITRSGTSTVYATSSDYRLKEDLKDFNALEIASKIKMYDFKWNSNNTRDYGVIAHELQEVFPQAVVGEKDAEEMQGVDYSKLVPILLKSIQELEARVKELEKEI